jgi:hypothetical protein
MAIIESPISLKPDGNIDILGVFHGALEGADLSGWEGPRRGQPGTMALGRPSSDHVCFPNGEKRYWWFSDREIANHAKTEQTLAPH